LLAIDRIFGMRTPIRTIVLISCKEIHSRSRQCHHGNAGAALRHSGVPK
jgi:hypothetical protein